MNISKAIPAFIVTMALTDLASAAGKKHDWKYKSVQASMCYCVPAFMGPPGQNTPCDLASFTIRADVAYNGKEVWGQQVDPPSRHSALGIKVKDTWHGFYNNGARKYPGFMDVGANGTIHVAANADLGKLGKFHVPLEDTDFQLRIDVYPDGTTKVRGWPGRKCR